MYVDFHAHILPRADHGSSSSDMSLAQLKNAAEAGVDTIIATPHFYIEQNTIDEFLDRRERCFNRLLGKYDGEIKIIKAAEVQLAIGLSELPDLEKLCIGDTKYILLEFPPEPWPYWMFDFVTDIIEKRGLKPIIAHIDRYSSRGRAKILNIEGAMFQVNAESLLKIGKTKRECLELLKNGGAHFIGSDVHGEGEGTYKRFSKAIKKIGEPISHITNNSRKILIER